MNLSFVVDWFRRYWLALWFGVIFVIRLGAFVARGPAEVGFDARLYLDATRAWLAGGDPWSVVLDGQRFAAPPPTLVPLAPLAVLPEALGVAIMLGLSVAGVVATVRLLRLPWWWLLFPPFLDGWWNGNPQTLLIPLILVGAGPVAAFLKIYAIVPIALTLRWRALAVTGIALLITAPFLPWSEYLAKFGELSDVLATQSAGGLSATAIPWLIPIGVVALVVCGRERAAWLAVPVLWPSTQWYYSTLAVPAVTPIAAAILAFQLPGAPVVAAVAVAIEVGARSWPTLRASWGTQASPAAGPVP
jgi:hypothetical protein